MPPRRHCALLQAPWINNYGVWCDEFEAMGLEVSCGQHRWISHLPMHPSVCLEALPVEHALPLASYTAPVWCSADARASPMGSPIAAGLLRRGLAKGSGAPGRHRSWRAVPRGGSRGWGFLQCWPRCPSWLHTPLACTPRLLGRIPHKAWPHDTPTAWHCHCSRCCSRCTKMAAC